MLRFSDSCFHTISERQVENCAACRSVLMGPLFSIRSSGAMLLSAVVVLLAAFTSSTPAQVASPPTAASRPASAPAIMLPADRLHAAVAALSEAKWELRQKATEDLITAGEQAYPAL